MSTNQNSKSSGVRLQDELFIKTLFGLGFFEMFTTDISDDVLRRMSDIRDPIRHPQDDKIRLILRIPVRN